MGSEMHEVDNLEFHENAKDVGLRYLHSRNESTLPRIVGSFGEQAPAAKRPLRVRAVLTVSLMRESQKQVR